jgi:hypothetical protein
VASGGRRENFWGISCEKSRFYTKKSYFVQLRREARKFLGYFVWKITILRQKIIFFPGGVTPSPPGSAPDIHDYSLSWLGTGISVKNSYVKLVLCAQTQETNRNVVSAMRCNGQGISIEFNNKWFQIDIQTAIDYGQ